MPRLHRKLQRDGWHVNYKRVKRLYRLEGSAARRRHRARLVVPRVRVRRRNSRTIPGASTS
ncbi:MAG: hypothetical protein IPK33_08540 [Gemmatimonadetes bacterium]|nr:hypothetical protein [Gemmatimonadota bacterium]